MLAAGGDVLLADQLLEQIVLGARATILQARDLVLQRLELLRVGDRAVVHAFLLGVELVAHRRDLVLERGRRARDRVRRQAELPEAGVGLLHLLAERRELLAGLELFAAVFQAVDRRVEVLQLEDPVQSAHRSARVADAERYTSVSCSPCATPRSPRDRENRAGGAGAGRTPPRERIMPETRRPRVSRSAVGA